MSLVDIANYEGYYKFNKDLNQVYNVKTNKYLKKCLDRGIFYFYLNKDGKQKKFRLNSLIYRYNNQDNQDDFVDIYDYKNYKINLKTNQVINIKSGKYIKNNLTNFGYYSVKLCKNGKIKNFQLHRLIFQAHNPLIDIKGSDIDHIDQDKLNNNINNLRKATHSQNLCNVKFRKNNILGIKNIGKTKKNTFQVQIMKDGKNYIKNFKSLEEAIEHRDLKLAEMHGEFACF